MKLTRLTRLAAVTAVSTMALGGLAAVVGSTAAHAATPTVTATPVSPAVVGGDGLPTGQTDYNVSLNLTGFDPNANIIVAECAGHGAAHPTDAGGCTGVNSDTSAFTDGSGNLTGDIYTISTITLGESDGTVACDASHPCTLYVGEQLSDFTQPKAFADFDILPASPTAPASTSPVTLNVGNLKSNNVTISTPTPKDSAKIPEVVSAATTVTTAPGHGTATEVSPGVFKYTNTDGSATTDSFTVAAATATCQDVCSPSSVTGNPVVVNVNIAPNMSNPPVAPTPQALTVGNLGSGSITVNEGTTPHDSNGNAETVTPPSTVTVSPTHGTVTNTAPGVFSYTNTDFSATSDSFTVAGATATCVSPCTPSPAVGNPVVVNVTIAPADVPSAPVAPTPQSLTVGNLGSGSITINEGPTPKDSLGQAETVAAPTTVTVSPTHGTVTNTAPGVFSYTNTDFSATSDSFTVAGAVASCAAGSVCHPTTATGNPVVVNVTIAPADAPSAPVAPTPQSLTVANLSSNSITINEGPTPKDSLGHAETVAAPTTVTVNPTHGTVTNTAPGVFKYTNTDGSKTSDSFTVAGALASCGTGFVCHPATATGNAVVVNVTIAPRPTTIVVQPGLLSLISPTAVELFNLSATITSAPGAVPVAGQKLVFTAGSTVICSATTNAAGTAGCSGTGSALNIILGLGYNVSFAGAPGLGASTGHGPLIRIASINIL